VSKNLKVIHHKDGTRTLVYTVSRLTKSWALKGVEPAIRALAGNTIKETDKIRIKRNKKT
jgi:hypothetical protein